MSEVSFAQLYDKYEKESGFTNLEAGKYTLRVKSSKNNPQKEYLQPIYEVVDGPKAGVTVGAGVISYKSDKARGVAFQKLAGFGLGKDYFKTVSSWDDVSKALVGRIIEVELGVQADGPFAGRNELPINGIKLVSAPDGAGNAAPAASQPPPPPPAAAAPPAGSPPPPPPQAEGVADADPDPAF